jgi:hypothetical protein
MAGQAGRGSRRSVCSRQRESRNTVIKGGRVPTFCGMASRTIHGRKSRAGSGMGRIIGLLPRRQMTLRVSAIRRRDRQVVIVVDVAGGARNVGMPVREKESCRSVVKIRRVPAFCGVTIRAVYQRKCRPGRRMHRIICLLPGR